MLKMKIICLYPNTIDIYGECNLFRIVDNIVKETIVVYYKKIKDVYEIKMINTMTGNLISLTSINELREIYELVEIIKHNESKIINLESLENVEIYISNLYKN